MDTERSEAVMRGVNANSTTVGSLSSRSFRTVIVTRTSPSSRSCSSTHGSVTAIASASPTRTRYDTIDSRDAGAAHSRRTSDALVCVTFTVSLATFGGAAVATSGSAMLTSSENADAPAAVTAFTATSSAPVAASASTSYTPAGEYSTETVVTSALRRNRNV